MLLPPTDAWWRTSERPMAGLQEHVVGNHRKTWGCLGRGGGWGVRRAGFPGGVWGEGGSRP